MAGRPMVDRAFVNSIAATEMRQRKVAAWTPMLAVIGCFVVILSTVGCATVKGEKYTYKNLPRQYVASTRENPQTVDLTRLASATTKTDVLDRGDVVEMTIAVGLNEKDTIKVPLRIQDDGCAEIPEIGRVKLAGMDIISAEATIISECVQRGLYRNPNITLVMKSKRMNRIMVAGAVKKPAIYDLPRGQCDLLSALSRAEGLDPTAGTQVIIRNLGGIGRNRPDSVADQSKSGIQNVGHSVDSTSSMSDTITVDLVSATKNGTGGYQLDDGAIVFVEKRDPEPLHVIGLVYKPGRFEFPVAEEIRVTDAIGLAGGINSIAADKIYVIRRKPADPNTMVVDPENPDKVQTYIIEVSLANAKQLAAANIRLAPGDVVSVEQTPMTFMMDRFQRTNIGLGLSLPLLGLF